MKKMKKVMALLLSLVMVLAMSIATFASEGSTGSSTTYIITIDDSRSGHTYEAYQIFAGDLSANEDGSKILSNIVWGKGLHLSGSGETGCSEQSDLYGGHQWPSNLPVQGRKRLVSLYTHLPAGAGLFYL